MKEILEYISASSILIPFFFAAYRFRTLKNGLKWLAILLFIATGTEALNVYMVFRHISNIWVMNLFSLIEAVILILIISRWLEKGKVRNFSFLLLVIYFLLWIYTTWNSTIFTFNSDEKSVKAFFLILLSGLTLLQLGKDENIILKHSYKFYILSAILIYFSLTLVVFGTVRYASRAHLIEYTWMIHSVFNIIANALFATGFIWYYRRMNLFSS